MKAEFKFPFLGLIISFVLLVLGYYLKEKDAHANIYMLFGKFSYFYSGIIFLISAVALILKSNKKQRGSSADERKSLSGLRELSWKDFNEYITGLFEKLGYFLVDKKGMNEEGTDLKLKRDGRLSIVRCKKYYVRKVPLSMVLEFYKTIGREPELEKGYFITTGFFSREARKFASEKQLELIDGVKLMDFVRIADSIDAAEEKSAIFNNEKMPGYTCPMCGAQMILRTVDSNPLTHFWGCSAYPACKGALRNELGDLESLEY
ncbi:MAG: restriction endonuclease [Thermodesulfovibrionales bacterium]